MDKEIIIDGVGCAFYDNGKCENPNGMSCNCINNAVCYYKELKRLEQENTDLKAENERLNRCLMEELHHEGEKIRETIKYKHTLQEIKAITENAYCLTNYTNKDMANFAKQILCLITKAEEE